MKNPSYRKRVFIGLFVQYAPLKTFSTQLLKTRLTLYIRCAAQSTGVLVVNNYQVLLYNGLGLYGYLPLLLYAVYTAWAAFLNWAGAMFVDRVGRIRMLIIGLVCAFSFSLSGLN